MSDLIDVPDEAAILAAQVMAGVDSYRDVGTAWVECARRAVAALPVLRAQIEAETRAKVSDEITARRGNVDPDEPRLYERGVAYGMDVARNIVLGVATSGGACSSLEAAARLARGETNG